MSNNDVLLQIKKLHVSTKTGHHWIKPDDGHCWPKHVVFYL